MAVSQLLNSRRSRTLSAATMLGEAALAFVRGNRRVAVALVGAAALAYRWSALGYAVEIGIRAWQRWR